MDLENWEVLGIPTDFAEKQQRVIAAFTKMGIVPTCTCTPYLVGNLPHYGETIAWAESSAVCYANAVIGARTNREGGPSALAAALTGRTAEYGLHLIENRQPTIQIEVTASLQDTSDFGAFGKALGERLTTIETLGAKPIPYILGIPTASGDQLKSFCASLATYGGLAIFHIEGITPEAHTPPDNEPLRFTQAILDRARNSMNDAASGEIDFISLGCPHLSLAEIAHLAELLRGRKVKKEFWITTARPTKQIADQVGYTTTIEASGAKFAADTCCVVAPIRGRFHAMATDSAKACYYASCKNRLKTKFVSFEKAVQEAIT
jgi:predicted aconitase